MTRITQSSTALKAANLLNDSSQALSASHSRRAAALLAGLLLASACALRVDASPIRRILPPRLGHIVRPLGAEDADGDKINDGLERAILQHNFTLLPNAVIQPHTALASIKGQSATSSTVVDIFVCFDHVPTNSDTAALAARGFTVKDVYTHAIYAVHVVGPTPAGVQTLRDLVSQVPGITTIEPNRTFKATGLTGTRQIGARQSWTTFEPHNVTLPLQGDPERAIAVMDTGIDGTHPDLTGGTDGHKIADYVDEVSDGTTPIDYIGHGSFVAGVAAGTGQSGGIATGTGYLPMTIATESDVIPYSDIPIDTTGFSDTATLTLNGYAPTFYPDETDTFGFLTDGSDDATSKNEVNLNFGTPGAIDPISVSVGIPVGTQENLYAYYQTYQPADVNTVAMAIQAPNTALGDGFNLVAGVAPASELVAIRAGDNFADFPEDAVVRGYDFVSANASLYNIGVLNLSYGLTDSADPTDEAIDSVQDTAVDSLVDQGVVCVAAAGNNRSEETAKSVAQNITSPGSASSAITVAAVGNMNQITNYSSYGGTVNVNDVGRGGVVVPVSYLQQKPDVAAPGGSFTDGAGVVPIADDQAITSVDSNFDDASPSGQIPDVQANDYTDDIGTSFSAPHVAGSAALLEQALTLPGAFGGLALSGGDEAYTIKSLLEMTTTEPNVAAEAIPQPVTNAKTGFFDPSARDVSAGFGKINTDAALGAVLNTILPGQAAVAGSFSSDIPTGTTTTATPTSQQIQTAVISPEAYAANVTLAAGRPYAFTINYGADATTNKALYQIYLYSSSYSFEDIGDLVISSGSNGDPIYPGTVSATATTTVGDIFGEGTQMITYTPTADEVDILVVKQISGSGSYTLASTGYTPTNLAVTVTDATTNNPVADAEVVATGTVTGLQYNQGPTVSTGTGTAATASVTLPVPTAPAITLSTTAFGYYGATQASAAGATAAAVALTPSHVFSTLGLQMISVPMGYSGQTIAQITLPQLDTAAVYEPSLNDYVVTPTSPADTFSPGQAYWVRLRQPTSINLQGTSPAAGTIAVPLQVGWNMIGSPYATPNSLGSATVTLASGTSESFAAANAAGVVGVLYSYDTTNNVYDPLGTSDALTPYLGYWVYAYQACSLNISGS